MIGLFPKMAVTVGSAVCGNGYGGRRSKVYGVDKLGRLYWKVEVPMRSIGQHMDMGSCFDKKGKAWSVS